MTANPKSTEGRYEMEKIYEIKEHILKFYASYSKYIDWGIRFILAIFTFAFINNQVGFASAISGPVATVGLALICSFLPITLTVVFAAGLVLVQFLNLSVGAAVVSGAIFSVMFAMYFRFAPGKSIILLLTPIAFSMEISVVIPIVFGLIGGPVCAIPIAFGTIIYYMISYVKSYAAVIETVAGTGMLAQITHFTQQLFANKEMWMCIASFTICLIFVYSIKDLSVDMAWEIAVAAGALANILLMTFGNVMLGIELSPVAMIVGSIVAALLAWIVELFVFSVDYSRTEFLQFEDDEYYYYVKAVPKISVAVSEKTVKKINVRQDTGEIKDVKIEKEQREVPKKTVDKTESDLNVRKKKQQNNEKTKMEESEIQKIIEEELKN